jgi:hypothetical protein
MPTMNICSHGVALFHYQFWCFMTSEKSEYDLSWTVAVFELLGDLGVSPCSENQMKPTKLRSGRLCFHWIDNRNLCWLLRFLWVWPNYIKPESMTLTSFISVKAVKVTCSTLKPDQNDRPCLLKRFETSNKKTPLNHSRFHCGTRSRSLGFEPWRFSEWSTERPGILCPWAMWKILEVKPWGTIPSP